MIEYLGAFCIGGSLAIIQYLKERKEEEKLDKELKRNKEITNKLLESEFNFGNNQEEYIEHNS